MELLKRLSLSSWRAWIEILPTSEHAASLYSRSPHGERGLKLLTPEQSMGENAVALLMESVD